MSMQAAKILMSDSEPRRILLGGSDPLELQRRIFNSLTIPKTPNLRRALQFAGDSNDEDLVARTFLASVAELIKKNGLTVDVAAEHVFETTWHFLMLFADVANRDMPRRLFGGVVWGILRMGDEIDLGPYLMKIITAPKFPPFMYVTGGKPEAEIKRLIREWTDVHQAEARMILAQAEKEMAEGRMSVHPPPLSMMVAEFMLYALVAKVPFAFKVGLATNLTLIRE